MFTLSADSRDGRSRQIWLRAGAPIFGLVIVIVFGALAVFWNLAQQQDRAFAESSRRLVASAVGGRVRALSNTTMDFAFWNDAFRAITVRWDRTWVEENYFSAVADGIVVFREDLGIRHHWFADEWAHDSNALAVQVVRNAGRRDEVRQIAFATSAPGMVLNRFTLWNDHLVLISCAPVSWETEAERLGGRPHRPVDFVASVDVLDSVELSQLGEALELQGLEFEAARGEQLADPALVRFPILDGDGRRLGDLAWRNTRPGTAGFLGEIWPITICLLLAGALATLVTYRLVRHQLGSIAHADAALESSRMKSEFIASMSHELRTPLNAIIGYTELIQEQAQTGHVPSHELRQDTARVLRAAKHLLHLINDILDHSRLDAGRDGLHREHVFAAEQVAEVVEVLEHSAKARGNALRVHVEEGVGCVVVDPRRLRQCLFNLVGNAIKFTADGTIEIRAKRERREGRDCVAFEIEDTGIGIEQDAIDRLFSPFVQANALIATQYGGSGLGLSITRKLARAMGGDVCVTSRAGKGSTFVLCVPAADDRETSLAA